MSELFGSYDIRAKYPSQIDKDDAYRIGRAVKTWKNPDEVIVGRDGREESDEIKQSLVEGLVDSGVHVSDEDLTNTPVINWACLEKNFDLGLMVTASHNPPGYTGIKITGSDGQAIGYEHGLKDLEKIYEKQRFDEAGGSVTCSNITKEYINHWVNAFQHLNPQEVVVNYGNGTGSVTASRVFDILDFDVVEINKEIDGRFPNHLPKPGSSEAQQAVKNHLGDGLGIIFDGDVDRAGFVLPERGYLNPEKVMSLLSRWILEETKGSVLKDMRMGKTVEEQIQKSGGNPIDTKVGHTHFSQRILQSNDVVFGGELSGHYYIPAKDAPYDDGLVTALTFIEMIQRVDIDSWIDSLPDYPSSPEYRIDCPQDKKENVMNSLRQDYENQIVSEKDGLKIEREGSTAVVRPSNTEPKISLKAEAEDPERLEDFVNEIKTRISNYA